MTAREYRLGQLAFLVALGDKKGTQQWIRDNSGLPAPPPAETEKMKLTPAMKEQGTQPSLKPLRAYFSKK
jgi:hypothetical protein